MITCPAFIVMRVAICFAQPTTAIRQLSQIDFTYLKIISRN